MTNTYQAWASIYETLEGETARETWRQGILRDLTQLGCAEGEILDIGAGTGIGRRMLLAGFPRCRVVSLDQSLAMMEAGGIPVDARIVADMAVFEIGSARFDHVVSGFDALNCLNATRLAGCFQSVARALKPGGTMIFDYSSRKMLKYDWSNFRTERPVQGHRLTTWHTYEPAHERTRVELHLTDSTRTLWSEVHYHYSVDPFLMHDLSTAAGLNILYARDIHRAQFSPACITHVYVLERVEHPPSVLP